MLARGSDVFASLYLLLIRGILAALRQKFHLPACPNLADYLSLRWLVIWSGFSDPGA